MVDFRSKLKPKYTSLAICNMLFMFLFRSEIHLCMDAMARHRILTYRYNAMNIYWSEGKPIIKGGQTNSIENGNKIQQGRSRLTIVGGMVRI